MTPRLPDDDRGLGGIVLDIIVVVLALTHEINTTARPGIWAACSLSFP
jgi:hypothetical protein